MNKKLKVTVSNNHFKASYNSNGTLPDMLSGFFISLRGLGYNDIEIENIILGCADSIKFMREEEEGPPDGDDDDDNDGEEWKELFTYKKN